MKIHDNIKRAESNIRFLCIRLQQSNLVMLDPARGRRAQQALEPDRPGSHRKPAAH